DPVVDLEGFAQMCLDAARLNGTSAHHLIALADLETQIRNVGAKTGATTGAGPFLISAASWAAATAGGVPVLAPVARFDPLKQPFVAGKIAADAAKVLQSGDQLPTSAQLYLATLVGADHAKRILAKPDVDFFTAIVAETDPATADALRQVRPWLFDPLTDVKGALEKIARAMDFGYVRADSLLSKVEHDLQIETAPAAGFALRLNKTATTEWEFFGEQTRNAAGTQTKAGHKENEARVPPGSGEDWFARVGTYWREGTGKLGLDGRNQNE